MPYYRAKNPTWNNTILDGLLAALTARPATAIAPAMTVALYTAPGLSVSPTSVLADFTVSEAAYTGYARLTPTFVGPVHTSQDVEAAVASVLFELVGTGTPVGANITGYVVITGSDWVVAETFADGEEINLGTFGDFLSLDLVLPLTGYQSAA